MTVRILTGDCRVILPTLDAGSVHTCVTSPPYFGLRDYGCDGQIGLESSLDEYVAEMVAVFRDVRRALRDDGTLWLNLGDSYASPLKGGGGDPGSSTLAGTPDALSGRRYEQRRFHMGALKPKDLCGVPWRVAFALQADGWYLRSEIIWAKPNPMPESVTDRPTKAHEQVFLFAKSGTYYYNADAIAETASGRAPGNVSHRGADAYADGDEHHRTKAGLAAIGARETRNARTVWRVPSEPFAGSHFAVMPTRLARPCVLAGSPSGGVVLDPFAGSGTVGEVASVLGRDAVMIELNPAYADLIRERFSTRAPLLAREATP